MGCLPGTSTLVTIGGTKHSIYLTYRWQDNVSLHIRPYRNTDAAALCRVFQAHFQAAGLACAITPLSLELCILGKPYFDPEHCLVVEQANAVVGFALLGFAGDVSLQTIDSGQAVVSALCILDQADADSIAHTLIEAACAVLRQTGASRVRFGPPPPATPYLAGLVPGDGMIGAPNHDKRLHRWLQAAGWQAEWPVVIWEVDLGSFHPPMDRTQIQIRRMAHVDRMLEEPILPWYLASMLGHAELIAFQLINRQTRSVTADAVVWMIGHELIPLPDVVAHLWPLTQDDCRTKDDQIIFLLAEAFRQLREDRVDLIRTIASQRDQEVSRLLERVGFQALLSGTTYVKAL